MEKDLKQWLAKGLEVDAPGHSESSLQLRSVKWRMKIRQRQDATDVHNCLFRMCLVQMIGTVLEMDPWMC